MSTTATAPAPIKYNVATLRAAGLEAKWTKTGRGAPIIAARHPEAKHKHQRETWWYITASTWETMQAAGIVEGFTRTTLLGDTFSV